MKNFRKKPLRKASSKAQSAMEYLMTYGWAILIISVVLAALFQLGVFNPMTFAPKAPPGSCQVFRPNGPGTTSFINLEGVCSGELPQYVGSFQGTYVQLPNAMPQIAYNYPFTISAWIDRGIIPANFIDNIFGNAIDNGVTNGKGLQFFTDDYNTNDGALGVVVGANGMIQQIDAAGVTVPLYSFHYVALVYNGAGNFIFYFDGVQYSGGSTTLQFSPTNNDGGANVLYAAIGARSGSDAWGAFYGMIANVQVYNTSLSANEIQALYLEGIGGAPIRLQNLVGWWPLNGNANDYSGNDNNGQISGNVNFVSNWYSGYTPP